MATTVSGTTLFLLLVTSFVLFINVPITSSNPVYDASYMQERAEFLKADREFRLGANLNLSDEEHALNNLLMKWKFDEISEGKQNDDFPPSLHFFHAKSKIHQSKVFQLIKTMPKGSALHIHDVSITDSWWIVKNVTYRDNCYMCSTTNHTDFGFFLTPPESKDCQWEPVAKVRNQSGNVEQFDQHLYTLFSLEVPDPEQEYPSLTSVWKAFQVKLHACEQLVFHRPVYRDYFLEGLKEFYEDNTQYCELRTLLPPLYELDGSKHDSEYTLKLYINASDQFTKQHPDFAGANFIYTGLRFSTPEEVGQEVDQAMTWYRQYSGRMAGYDLVGQEGAPNSHPLIDYITQLLKPNGSLPYFFHAGETDWKGIAVDDNLLDAVLLNTSRIGHGYAITKHPRVMQLVVERNIAIEVNPLSNQILGLVKDLRNHPAAELMSLGYPLVISSDDPGVWGATGLSYDFYSALMAFGGNVGDLATLKQLALNSLTHTAMTDSQRSVATETFQRNWNKFVKNALLSEFGGA